MSDNLATGVVSIALAILGLATLAVIFSKKSDTSGVIIAAANALGSDISAATGPVTGNSFTALQMPSSTSF